MIFIQKRKSGRQTGHGDTPRLILRKRIQREILRKFIAELLGFGDDPAFEGVGNTFLLKSLETP